MFIGLVHQLPVDGLQSDLKRIILVSAINKLIKIFESSRLAPTRHY